MDGAGPAHEHTRRLHAQLRFEVGQDGVDHGFDGRSVSELSDSSGHELVCTSHDRQSSLVLGQLTFETVVTAPQLEA